MWNCFKNLKQKVVVKLVCFERPKCKDDIQKIHTINGNLYTNWGHLKELWLSFFLWLSFSISTTLWGSLWYWHTSTVTANVHRFFDWDYNFWFLHCSRWNGNSKNGSGIHMKAEVGIVSLKYCTRTFTGLL